jgi:mannose-6-phosphate isomerase-like protein (cupin superfamily)
MQTAEVGHIIAEEKVFVDGELCAIILPAEFDRGGIMFFTSAELSQQLASMSYPRGKIIPAHTHNLVDRKIQHTQEALFIRKGRVRVDFYSNQQGYQKSRILGPGDVILLVSGVHGFEVLEDLNMVEVKQGPYSGANDKTRFYMPLPKKFSFD